MKASAKGGPSPSQARAVLHSPERAAVAPDCLRRFGQPLDYPYLLGVYLAVNAISDLGVAVDGPDCALGKAEHLFGSHDLRSSLLDAGGAHRVACTWTDPRNAALAREEAARATLAELAGRRGVNGVLLSALPMALVTGVDYARLARDAGARGKPVFPLPNGSLRGGYLAGYADALETLARCLALPAARTDPRKAAVIGCLLDRNEAEDRANLRELRRMLRGAGLIPVSVWPDGGPLRGLQAAAEAGTLISLPYGRAAARALAARTGARVVELGLPLGLDGARRFVAALGEAADERKAGRFIDVELDRAAPALEWAVARLLHRRAYLALDPHLLDAAAGCFEEWGLRVAGGAACGRLAPALAGALVRPTSGALAEDMSRAAAAGAELFVGGSDALRLAPPGAAAVELGFPSRGRHSLFPAPLWGFPGALRLAELLVNALGERRA